MVTGTGRWRGVQMYRTLAHLQHSVAVLQHATTRLHLHVLQTTEMPAAAHHQRQTMFLRLAHLQHTAVAAVAVQAAAAAVQVAAVLAEAVAAAVVVSEAEAAVVAEVVGRG